MLQYKPLMPACRQSRLSHCSSTYRNGLEHPPIYPLQLLCVCTVLGVWCLSCHQADARVQIPSRGPPPPPSLQTLRVRTVKKGFGDAYIRYRAKTAAATADLQPVIWSLLCT